MTSSWDILCSQAPSYKMIYSGSWYFTYHYNIKVKDGPGRQFLYFKRYHVWYKSLVKCKVAVSPLLTHWRYCSLALSHRNNIIHQKIWWNEISYSSVYLWHRFLLHDLLISSHSMMWSCWKYDKGKVSTVTSWRLKCLASLQFVQQLVQETSNKTPKLCIVGLFAVDSPHKGSAIWKTFTFLDVSTAYVFCRLT